VKWIYHGATHLGIREGIGARPLKVRVEYIGHIKNMTENKREEEIETDENVTITDLLTHLSKKYGEPFKKAIYEPKGSDVKPNYIITVNGYLLNQLKGLQTKLKKGDHVALLPIVSGG
jgi:MoaD family protein